MKKTLLLMLIILLLSGCKNTPQITDIEVINIENGENIKFMANSKEAELILKALNKKEKTNEDISSLFTYGIKLNSEDNTETLNLYFDVYNSSAFLLQNDMKYKIKSNISKELFLSDVFSYIYVDATIYNSYIYINDKKVVPETEYNWNVKNIEGRYINETGSIKQEDESTDKLYLSAYSLDIVHEKTPDIETVKVYDESDNLIAGKNVKNILDSIENDGEYFVECRSQWLYKEGAEFYGSKTLKFTVLIDRPAKINIITKENYPGNILLISADNLNDDETISISTDAVKIENDIYAYKNKKLLMYPIDLYAQPGEHVLTAIVNGGTEKEYILEETLRIADKSFKTQYLTVSQEMNETNNDNAAIFEFAQLVKPARTVSFKEKLWEGVFIMPVEGELTTDFAEIRYVNNEPSSSRHSGIDLAAPKGTPVKAPNNGIVVFSMEGLLSPGNTIVLDHGLGLFTSYYHLDTIDVKKGDKVEKGDIIGTVGTTGFSTGPHLHYALSIYNTYVNPYQGFSGIID